MTKLNYRRIPHAVKRLLTQGSVERTIATRTSTEPYSYDRARAFWNILFITLPLDALLLYVLPRPSEALPEAASIFDPFIIVCALCGLIFARDRTAVEVYEFLRATQSKGLLLLSSGAVIFLLGVLSLVQTFLPALIRLFGDKQYPALILIIVFFVLAIAGALRESIRFAHRRASLKKAPILGAFLAQRELFLLVIAPLVVTRALSLLAVARALLLAGDVAVYLPYGGLSLLLLMCLAPQRTQFFASCRSCASRISIASRHAERCVSCSEKLRKP